MKPETLRYRVLLALGAMVVGFLAVSWLPRELERRSLRAELSLLERELGVREGAGTRLSRLQEETAALREVIASSRKYVPRELELAELVRDVTRELERAGGEAAEIQTGAVVRGQDYHVAPLGLEFRGSFASTFAFLRELESRRRLIRVTELRLWRDVEEPGRPLEASVDLVTFTAPTPQGSES